MYIDYSMYIHVCQQASSHISLPVSIKTCSEILSRKKDISINFSYTAERLPKLPVISTVTSGRGGYSNI